MKLFNTPYIDHTLSPLSIKFIIKLLFYSMFFEESQNKDLSTYSPWVKLCACFTNNLKKEED